MHAQAWGSAFNGAKSGIWAFAGSLCIGEFKTFISRNLKLGKRRQTSSPNGQLLKLTEIFPKTKEAQWGEGSWLLVLIRVAANVSIQDGL